MSKIEPMDNQTVTWQEEVDHHFARLQQIAPRAVKLYKRPIYEEELPAFRNAMKFWERENDKTVAALKRAITKF